MGIQSLRVNFTRPQSVPQSIVPALSKVLIADLAAAKSGSD